MTSSPRTKSTAPSAVVSRNWHLASVSEASSYFSVFPHAAVSTTSQVGENSVLSSCGCVVYSGRSRPAEERGARIETASIDISGAKVLVAPQKNAGRGLKRQQRARLA